MEVNLGRYRVAIYLRLSRDDAKIESLSIQNQRAFLVDYVRKNKGTIEKVYIDDGYTGFFLIVPGSKI